MESLIWLLGLNHEDVKFVISTAIESLGVLATITFGIIAWRFSHKGEVIESTIIEKETETETDLARGLIKKKVKERKLKVFDDSMFVVPNFA